MKNISINQEFRENMNYFRFESGGASLSAVVFLPSTTNISPGVVLFHGLSNSRHLDPLAQDTANLLQSEGFATMQFDFYGSGESEGLFHEKFCSTMEVNAKDALSIFREIPHVDPMMIGLWGRSVGGPMAALLANQVTSTVMVSPGYKMSKTFAPIMEPNDSDGFVPLSLKYPHRLIKGDWKLKSDFFEELPNVEERMREIAQKSKNVCVIQGDADLTIPEWRDSEELLNCYMDPKKFVRIAGASHRYSGKKDEVLKITLDWFSRFLKK